MTAQSKERTGVVLAAGFGSRLAEGRTDSLKPLTQVGGKPLIQRTLDSLLHAGCDTVVIVLGFRAGHLEEEIRGVYSGPLSLRFVYNPNFDKSNGLSVLAARPYVNGEFVLVMADHVVSDDVMKIARDHQPPADGASLLVDRKISTIFDMDDATKVSTNGDRIVAIGKTLTEFDCIDTGVFVCTDGLFDALDEVRVEKGDASLSDGIASLARHGVMTAVDIADGFWQDVDTPEMLAHAERSLAAMQ
ncbi:MAG: NTP transferase domain-containing protein [Rhodothermia bacterium]|nr:NTP transferase domain-containing protein [Rhodothermia bacterium]